jgi:hypothetical protein
MDLMKKAGYSKAQCMRFMAHLTDSMFEWYGVGDDDDQVVETAKKFEAFLVNHRRRQPAPIDFPKLRLVV